MYILGQMPSGEWFGICIEDDYYVESDNWADVSEAMEKHELTI